MATEQPDKIEAQGRVISNFALTHFNAAKCFAQAVNEIEKLNAGQPFGNFFEEVSIYCSSGVIAAAASIESLINEIFIYPSELRDKILNFEEYFWGSSKKKCKFLFFCNKKYKQGLERSPALIKYREALKLLKKPQFNKNEDIYSCANAYWIS